MLRRSSPSDCWARTINDILTLIRSLPILNGGFGEIDTVSKPGVETSIDLTVVLIEKYETDIPIAIWSLGKYVSDDRIAITSKSLLTLSIPSAVIFMSGSDGIFTRAYLSSKVPPSLRLNDISAAPEPTRLGALGSTLSFVISQ